MAEFGLCGLCLLCEIVAFRVGLVLGLLFALLLLLCMVRDRNEVWVVVFVLLIKDLLEFVGFAPFFVFMGLVRFDIWDTPYLEVGSKIIPKNCLM